MEFKIFTLGLHSQNEQEYEMNKFLRTHKVVSVEKEFVSNGMQSCWSFCICFLATATNAFSKETKIDHAAALAPEHLKVYESLRVVRNALSKQLSIPAYAVFTNEELAFLSKEPTINQKTLESMKGFGEGRMEKTGNLFLKTWNETSEVPF